MRTTRRKRRTRRRVKKWISGAVRKRKGALHRMLGVPIGEKIPIATLRKAAKEKGLLGKRARLALILRKFHRTKK